jgi:Uma2 family endonuclease
MVISTNRLDVSWEKLPEDYVLDDEPVDNINQPALAAALSESLAIAGRLPQTALTSTNYAICATLNQRIVVKAPDWSFVPTVRVARDEIIRSYTPMLQGEFPLIVMEFLSDTEGGEYSSKPTYPPGKWFFYEQVLNVPTYAIFDPSTSLLEVYRLDDAGRYQPQTPNEQGRFWIAEIALFLGVWQGTRENRTGPWLRWWDETDQLLPWGL